RSAMSRNGDDAGLASWTATIRPPCSTTNTRPWPSPAPMTRSGLSKPDAYGSRVTCRPVRSRGPVGVGEAPLDGEAVADPEAVEDAEAVGGGEAAPEAETLPETLPPVVGVG